MIDQSHISLSELIGQTINLRRQPNGEYRGKCPQHDGTSNGSLVVFKDNSNEAWCCYAGCGGGDAIAWVRFRDGVSFVEACQRLPIDEEHYRHMFDAVERKLMAPQKSEPPPQQWQDAALSLVETCEGLLTGKARESLKRRGFTDATLQAARLGYNPTDRYMPRSRFGLEPSEYQDAQGNRRIAENVFIPRGIIIPWFVDGQLWKVFVRADKPKEGMPKYKQLPGGSNALYNADNITADKPVIICEGALDALAIQQEAGDLIVPVASGTTGARSARWIGCLSEASNVLLSFDNDDGGRPATQYWQYVFVNGLIWRAYYDDPAGMLETGMDVRSWVMAGLAQFGATQPTEQLSPLEMARTHKPQWYRKFQSGQAASKVQIVPPLLRAEMFIETLNEAQYAAAT